MHPMTTKTSMKIEEQNMKIPAGAVSLVVDGGALVIFSMKRTVLHNPLLL